jgi:hypothetical protein
LVIRSTAAPSGLVRVLWLPRSKPGRKLARPLSGVRGLLPCSKPPKLASKGRPLASQVG